VTPEEYKQLEKLLGKLTTQFDDKNICIIPNFVHDGYCVGVYNKNTGKLEDEYIGATIESCVRKHNSPMILK
jgi:hypothetical protein